MCRASKKPLYPDAWPWHLPIWFQGQSLQAFSPRENQVWLSSVCSSDWKLGPDKGLNSEVPLFLLYGALGLSGGLKRTPNQSMGQGGRGSRAFPQDMERPKHCALTGPTRPQCRYNPLC